MSDISARSVTRATVRNVIIRACAVCGHGREQGRPCEGCGNPLEPEVHDLGIQSYYHRNPLRRLGWALIGSRLAARKVRQATASH